MRCAIYFDANSQILLRPNNVKHCYINFTSIVAISGLTYLKDNKKTYRVLWEWRYDAQSQLDTYRRHCHSTWRYAAIIPVGFFPKVSRKTVPVDWTGRYQYHRKAVIHVHLSAIWRVLQHGRYMVERCPRQLDVSLTCCCRHLTTTIRSK